MKKQGIDNYTVWAHATPGHTVRNCNVRVFSALGNAELSNFIILKSSDKKQNFEDIKEWGYARIGAKKSTIFERHLSIQPTEKPPLEKVLHSNLIKMLVVATAESFNWKWQHGLCAEKSADSEKVEEIRKVIAELHSYIVKKENAKNKGKDTFIEVDDEEVVFKSNTTRSHLLVSEKNKPKVKNPQLSKHFMWKDIVGKYPVAKQEYEVPVNTIKALQMLHHRQYPKTELTKKKANKVTKKFEILNISGGEIRFLAEQKDIQAVLDKAKELKKQGFIEWAVREDPAMNIIKMKVVV